MRDFIGYWKGAFGLMMLVLMGCVSRGDLMREGADLLPELIVERLSWMDEVAMVKRVQGLPVADGVREAALLDAMEVLGADVGLSSGVVRSFFSGQIRAAKVFQEEWLKASSGSRVGVGALPDLGKTVRPELDAIGRRMIAALAKSRESGRALEILRASRERLIREGYSQGVIEAVIEGLAGGLSVPPV